MTFVLLENTTDTRDVFYRKLEHHQTHRGLAHHVELLQVAEATQWTNGWMCGWMNGCVDGCVDGWMDGWMDGWVGFGWVDGWMDGWMDGWVGG